MGDVNREPYVPQEPLVTSWGTVFTLSEKERRAVEEIHLEFERHRRAMKKQSRYLRIRMRVLDWLIEFTIKWKSPATAPTAHISSPPGTHLLLVAEFLYSRQTFEEILRPAIEDMRSEYNTALVSVHRWKARWVRLRGTWSFVTAAGLVTFGSVGRVMVRFWKLIP
jgi:hypothetical protein